LGGGEADIVELSSQERDAFREIARALGARNADAARRRRRHRIEGAAA